MRIKTTSQVKSVFLFIIFFVCCFSIYAEDFFSDYVSRAWTVEDGLPGNTITDIIQTDKGYIYLGTYDGLVRFDGLNFEIYNKNTVKGFQCVSARCLFSDSKNNLWVGSNDEGVLRINGKNIDTYTTAQGIPNNSIRDIIEDNKGNIWIGTAGGVVYLTPNNEIVSPLGLEEYDAENVIVTSLYCSSDNKIWMTTSRKDGLYCYVDSKFSRVDLSQLAKQAKINEITDSKILSDSVVISMIYDNKNTLWFGLQNQGMISINDEKCFYWGKDSGVIAAPVNCIFQDSESNIWFGTEKGISLLHKGIFYSYTEEDGLSNNNITEILEDREGSIWFATDRGGVERLSLGKFRTYSIDSTVNCIAQDNDSTVWIGTDSGLLCLENDIQVENKLTNYCNDVRIRDVSIANNGAILVSTYALHGLVYYFNDKIIEYKTEDGLAGLKVRDSLQAKNNDLYVATTTGLSIIDSSTNQISNITGKNGLTNEYIMCIYQDNKDRIWLGTDGGGIAILENGKITKVITTEDGLAGNVIFKIFQDSDKNFWICTGSGITCYDEQNFYSINSSNGLTTDSVFQMIIDVNDTVWMTTNKGVLSADFNELKRIKKDKSKKIEIRTYTKNDGLITLGATSTSVSMKDKKDRIWFTLVDGYAIYDYSKIKDNQAAPLVNIEKLILDGEEVTYTDGMKISPDVKRIDIMYTGISFISPERIRFSYKLTGYDEKFSPSIKERQISYTNLKPGNYTFSVFASNSDGVWSLTPSSFSFEKEAHFYQTWKFFAFIIILVFLIILFIVFMNVRKVQIQQKKLESLIQMRTIDLQEAKNKTQLILQNIFPKPVIERLKLHREKNIADKFDESTVLMVEITNMKDYENESIELVVTQLNDLLERFDQRVLSLGLEKIHTSVHEYMVVCGIPFCNKNHANIVVKCAWGMLQDLAEFNSISRIKFTLRFGINSGYIFGAIVGKVKVGYDVFGSTVDIAKNLAKNNKTELVCVTQETKELLPNDVIIFNEDEITYNSKKQKVYYLETQQIKEKLHESIDSVFDEI